MGLSASGLVFGPSTLDLGAEIAHSLALVVLLLIAL